MSSKIDKFLAFDCETSGINFDALSVAEGYQMVSVGFIVVNAGTFSPIEELYVEIKWNGVAGWSTKAESVHGLSKEYLEIHGKTESEAAEIIALFLYKHFGMDTAISLLGHNVVNFDLPFLKEFLWRNGLPFKFAHRHCETFALSMGTVQANDSNEIFEMLGLPKRTTHHALEDARNSLKFYQVISKMWKRYVERK